MPDWSRMKLGKRPARPDSRTLRLERYLALSALPPILDVFDWGTRVPQFGMHGNDRYGDCVFAAQANQEEADSANSGTEHVVSDAAVLQAYHDVTGFNPNDPNTDRGTDPLAGMNYWRQTGIDGRTIGAYAAVDPGHADLLKAACYLFGGLQLGLALPRSAQTQSVWDVPPGGPVGDGAPGSWGGHMVYVRGLRASGNYLIETWNEALEVTPAFIRTYCLGTDLFACIPLDWLDGRGQAPSGFNQAQLLRDLAIVSGQPDPTPPVSTTTTVVVYSPQPATVGQPVTLRAQVAAADGSVPTGPLTFSRDGAAVMQDGRAPAASLVWSPQTAGTFQMAAHYGGDATHAASASAPVTVTVQQPPQPKPDPLQPLYDWLVRVAAYEVETHDKGELAVIVRTILAFYPDAGKAV